MSERRKPYRTQPVEVSAEELAQANASRPDALPAWESLEISLGRMESEPDDTEQIHAWLTHPDERVVLAALADERWGLMVHERADLQVIVARHALDDAEKAALAWTPVLEKLFAWDMWADFDFMHAGLDANDRVTLMSREISRWLEQEAEEEDVRAMVGAYDGIVVNGLVARHARVLPNDVVSVLVEQGHHYELAANPALSDAGADQVIAVALAPLLAGKREIGAASLKVVLRAFAGRKYRLSEVVVDRLLANLGDVLGEVHHEIGKVLPRYPFLPASRLIPIFDSFRDMASADVLVTNAREADIDFYRHVVSRCAYKVVHETIAAREPARSDRVVRDALIERGTYPAMIRLMSDVTEAEFPRVIAAMMKVSEPVTAKWIRENGLPAHLRLSPLDLAPLLEAKSGELRQVALTHLSVAREHVQRERAARRNASR